MMIAVIRIAFGAFLNELPAELDALEKIHDLLCSIHCHRNVLVLWELSNFEGLVRVGYLSREILLGGLEELVDLAIPNLVDLE